MRPSAPLTAALLLALAFAFNVQAAEGVYISETNLGLAAGGLNKSEIRVEPARVSIETLSPSGDRMRIVFNAATNILRMIHLNKGFYQDLTQQDVSSVGTMTRRAVPGMPREDQEELRNLPPHERALAERAMRQRMGGPRGPATGGLLGMQNQPVIYTRTQTGKKVKEWTCDVYEGRRGMVTVAQVCTVDFQVFGLAAGQFQIFSELGEFFRAMSPQAAESYFQVGEPGWQQRQGFPGIPVERTVFVNGQPFSKHTVEKVERQSFTEEPFSTPDNFMKQQFLPAIGARPLP